MSAQPATFWWVHQKSNEVLPIGPFDTERDAKICAKALNYYVDWQTWLVEQA